MLAAMLVGVIAGAATAARADGAFYVITRECTTTVARFESGSSLSSATKAVEPPEIKRCVRDGSMVRCHAQLALGGSLSDHPVHGSDEYAVISNGSAVLQLHGEGMSWMTVNLSTGTVVTGLLANSPAANPEAIDAIASTVCRGIIAAPNDLPRPDGPK